MAVATAPVEYKRQIEREHLVTATSPATRWGPPIWPADEPIAALDRVPDPGLPLDAVALAMLLSQRTD